MRLQWRQIDGAATRFRNLFEDDRAALLSDADSARAALDEQRITRPRILILSASCGSGHVRAAEAVQLALEKLCPDAVLADVDVMTFTNRVFRRLYSTSYFELVEKAPHLVGYLYDRLDRPPSSTKLEHMSSALQRLNMHRLTSLIVGRRWDLAVSTHFLPAEIIAWLRTTGKIRFPQATVITDFDTHRLWSNDPCEAFFTASGDAKANLSANNVAPEKIRVTGIPIHPVFARPKDAVQCRERHRLSIDRPVVLQLAGGSGFGRLEKVHAAILQTQIPLHVVVVAGRNAQAKNRLEATPCPARHRRTVFGFTGEIDELMAAADLIVSKPGGLTSSEALARGAAMVIVDPIPGQESRNSDYLLENGAAIRVNNLASLGYRLQNLLTEPGRLSSMRAAARKLSRPRAAYEVAEQLLTLLEARAPGGDPCVAEDFSGRRQAMSFMP